MEASTNRSEGHSPPAPPWRAWLLLGPTGSGKTPLGDLLQRRGLAGRPCAHFDFGRCLRAADADPRRAKAWGLDAAERRTVADVLRHGTLLEAPTFAIALKILDAFVADRLTHDGLLLMNGLPRHADQARWLESRLRVARVLQLDCEPETVRARLHGYPGGDRARRTDDDPAAVQQRLALYAERTAPLADYYTARGARRVRIRVGPADDAAALAARLPRR